ncbi:hypothetical protein BGZ61DRAFT_539849 [Ilyonectria robusta]|uniref:uncharacterized protein n=1 Tax=Ilyonectria robusta TaxID=1079257 RepID=UPI001E8D3F4D|nr:uncharacterized protein BGZ61DRAFT_539849 [Ilyonectria robusta]KAH8661179.1 hypothetical protein BGZ61DRAFT_539849 [Ilyonectria robusta]
MLAHTPAYHIHHYLIINFKSPSVNVVHPFEYLRFVVPSHHQWEPISIRSNLDGKVRRVATADGSEVDLSDHLDPDEFPDLDKIIITDWTTHEPQQGIMSWIDHMHRRSRGLELGTFGSRLLSSAFREQSAKWALITKQYLSKIILAIHRFILRAIREVCTDPRVREELISSVMNELLPRYSNGMEQAIFLVEVEREKRPVRITEALKGQARRESTKWGKLVVELNSIQSTMSNMSNAEHTAEDIHDILHAYYKVACKRFIDNVYHQAVDHCLLSGPMSPLALFPEQWVLQLDIDKLTAIAGEARITRDNRERLEKTIQDLEEAVKILH